jgi:FkbM family methyltransferase
MNILSALTAVRRLLAYSRHHPVGRRQPLRTLGRIADWQFRSRLMGGPIVRPWIGGAKLVVERGMTGATGNLFFGLHEFPDMAFALHLLREDDLFVDIGANVGTWSVLAAKLRKAEVVAFEPDPETASRLIRNLEANGIRNRVSIELVALGAEEGNIGFTVGRDAMNRVATSADESARLVPIRRLDTVLAGKRPLFMKIDVEGHEEAVLAGAERILAQPSLLALQIETVSDAAAVQLKAAGFHRRFYDPIRRELTDYPGNGQANNQLFVRDEKAVKQRCSEGPSADIFGWRV